MTSAHAEQQQFYVGLGANYILPNFEEKEFFDWDNNALGVNANFGYRLSPLLFFQFDLDYIPSVEGIFRPYEPVDLEIGVVTGIVSLKGYFPDLENLQFTYVKPYVIAGVGLMNYEVDVNIDGPSDVGFTDDNEFSICYKIGLGLDFILNDYVSLGLDGSYVIGPTNADIGSYEYVTVNLDDIEYFKFTAGLALHF
jgi:hypothetical protein